jgi:F-type H+-transporting ATPase subunit alpha
MKAVAGSLRLDLAQYRELEAFSAFGSDLDKASKAALERGARMVELLKQPQYSPFSVERQVVSLWAGTTGELDDVPTNEIRRFEAEFLDYIGREHKGIFDTIEESKNLDDSVKEQLTQAIAAFKKSFQLVGGEPLINEAPAHAMDAADVGQESIKKYKPAPAETKSH